MERIQIDDFSQVKMLSQLQASPSGEKLAFVVTQAQVKALRERYGNKIAPLVVPMWDADKKTTGLIDVLNKRAYEMQDFKRVEVDIPPEKADVVAEFNEALKESVAETSDEMMDKYFSGESFTYAEMIQGLRQGVSCPCSPSSSAPPSTASAH